MNVNAHAEMSRRAFLASSAAAAATVSFGARAETNSRPLRIGLIGPGRYGSKLLQELETIGPEFDTSVAAVHRDSLGMIHKESVDGVIIATPDHLHAETALAALESGLHVFCAPPMAMNEADARAVRDAANASGVVYRLGVESVHETRWQAARALVQSGVIGDVRWVSATTHEFPIGFGEGWKADARYTHGAAAHHLHELWSACAFATGVGAPTKVTSMGGGSETDPALPDGLCVSADFAGGGHFNLDCVPARQAAPQSSIRGSVASLVICEECIFAMPESRANAPLHEVWRGKRARNSSPLRSWLSDIRTGDANGVDADLAYGSATGIAKAMDAYRRCALV